MLTFLADARDGSSASASTCGSCCCKTASARPGETNPWIINYQPWVAPIGGRGIVGTPQYTFTKVLTGSTLNGANKPPTNTDYLFATAFGVPVVSTVATNAVDPEGQPISFATLPLYPPQYGTLVFNPNGTFTYTPQSNWYGYDSFYFTSSDGVNAPVVNKVTIQVNPLAPVPALPAPPTIPTFYIDPLKFSIRNPTVQFPVQVSPAAVAGDVWRLTLLVTAADCDATTYQHTSCFDITVGNCG
jgi:hypothetical protein